MIVGRLRGEVGDRARLGRDLRFAFLVGHGNEAVGVGDVERVADKGHALGRIGVL